MGSKAPAGADMMPRIFRYVVRYDSGVAPRPFDGYCSLAICKPKIWNDPGFSDMKTEVV